jgi:hypothetical protein
MAMTPAEKQRAFRARQKERLELLQRVAAEVRGETGGSPIAVAPSVSPPGLRPPDLSSLASLVEDLHAEKKIGMLGRRAIMDWIREQRR